jgi:hypothetical protein
MVNLEPQLRSRAYTARATHHVGHRPMRSPCPTQPRALLRISHRLQWKHLDPWLVLVINDNVILYVPNVCFAETNGKLGRITGRCTTTVKTIPKIRSWSDDWNDETKDEGLHIPSVKELRTLGVELGLLFCFSGTIKRGCRWVVWPREF